MVCETARSFYPYSLTLKMADKAAFASRSVQAASVNTVPAPSTHRVRRKRALGQMRGGVSFNDVISAGGGGGNVRALAALWEARGA